MAARLVRLLAWPCASVLGGFDEVAPAVPLRREAEQPLMAAGSDEAPTVRLRNGVEMPLLGAGSARYSDSEAADVVKAALKADFVLIDTAFDYKDQRGVGKGVADSGRSRESVFLETKVPGCGLDPAISMSACYGDTAKVLEEDLRQLNMSYVDLVIVHFPPAAASATRSCVNLACEQVQNQWRALEEFYEAGKARAIGVSNYCASCFACLDSTAKVYPMVNQVNYHIGMGPDAGGFKSFADSKGVVLQAYSPLGKGHQRVQDEILHGELTTRLAKAHGKSSVQVALKWLVQRGMAVVTESKSLTHLRADLDLWSWNLTEAEMAEADRFDLPGMPSFACDTSFSSERELLF